MNFIEIKDLPVYNLYSKMQNLISEGKIYFPKEMSQICLNTIAEFEDDFILGTGSLWFDWSKSETVVDSEGNVKLVPPKREQPLHEKDFVNLCSQFKNTLFEDVYNELRKKYNIGRVRIMKSNPKTCLTWHTDDTPRIHFPIKTQEGCFMIIDNEVKHLPLKTWWFTNTLIPHTAMNASLEDRIHLVVSVLQ